MTGCGRSARGSNLLRRWGRAARREGRFHNDLVVHRTGSGVRSLCRETVLAGRRPLADGMIEHEVDITARTIKLQTWTGTTPTRRDGAIALLLAFEFCRASTLRVADAQLRLRA